MCVEDSTSTPLKTQGKKVKTGTVGETEQSWTLQHAVFSG